MQGLVSDTLSSVGRIDEVTKKHHEAQLEITDKLLDLARKAQPPPPPPDWPSMFEKITGHLSTVVLGAMKAREALPAPKITPALPAPEKDSALDDVKEALLKATAEIAETRKRTDRIEEMFLQLLAAKQQPEARPPEARPPEAKPPEAKPEPKPPEPKPPEPKQPEPKQDATDSDDPPSPPPIAANESTTNAPAEPAPIARNPHRVAWNRIKRMIVSLTDGDIIAFLVQPQLAVMYLGILAAMVPPC